MNKSLADTEREFINRMGKIAKQWGISEPVGRVWGTLLFSDKPISQKDIARKTGYTLSLVSPSLKIIESMDMVRSVRSGNKEKVYETKTSFMEGFRIIIKRFLEKDIKPLIEELENTKAVEKNRRISRLITEYRHVERYLRLCEKMECMKRSIGERIRLK